MILEGLWGVFCQFYTNIQAITPDIIPSVCYSHCYKVDKTDDVSFPHCLNTDQICRLEKNESDYTASSGSWSQASTCERPHTYMW